MNDQLFRKKSVERVSSPEQLNDYIRVANPSVWMILAAIVMVINQKFFISGFKSLFHGSPNMDTLVALGLAASVVIMVGKEFCFLWVEFV